MDRDQAKDYIKGQLEGYLADKGINTRKPFKCLNPDHQDKHPSMSYDRARQKVHCFSCNEDYDTLDLIGIDYGIRDSAETFKKAYEIFGIQGDSMDTHKHIPTNAPTEPPVDYTSFYRQAHEHINETDYPQRRGLSAEIVDRFLLGYAPNWTHPKAPNAPQSPRLIIPTSISSYLARDTRAELTEQQKQYSKSKVGSVRIFNSKALQTATKPIFIVEGEIDALSIIEVGGEAIATGSTANWRALLELVKAQKPTQPLIIALDNDEAGDKAAQELAQGLSELQVSFYRHNPYGTHKDANEALLADREAFKLAVEEGEHSQDAAKEAEREAYLQTSAAAHLQDFIDGITKSADTPFIATGFPKLDEVLDGGLYEGLYILGAISSLGKTTLLLQMADNIARAGNDVLIFSLEMARSELMAKSISRHTLELCLEKNQDRRNAKTARGITTGDRYINYNIMERELIKSAVSTYGSYAQRIYISEGMGAIGAQQVREAVEKHISITGKAPTVIIDYLQLLAAYSDRMTDKQNTDKAVLELKRISRDYKNSIVAISSFNRSNYNNPVAMEAFKESGAIEYSSDVLIGLQFSNTNSEVNEEKRKDPRKIDLVILKNRSGQTGETILFDYYPMFNYFKEIDLKNPR